MEMREHVLDQYIETTARWILEAEHVIVFTGAGISTASGIPDYRGPDGVWTRRDKGLPPPPLATPIDQVGPNAGHDAIVRLERLGRVQLLISQNVDGLHRRSGFPAGKIVELHGNRDLMRCVNCERSYTRDEIGWDENRFGRGYRTDKIALGQPACPACGGRIISSIVNFGDDLPRQELTTAMEHSKHLCDLFIVLGSSLVVTPAARMVYFAKRHGARLVINNLGETPYDRVADLLMPCPINDFFPPVVDRVSQLLSVPP
jgi:NAD-dependent SIR2 family protein deacetylase